MPETGAPKPRKAAEEVVSLAQVLLAPLDALFQAQVHAGRSFLNFLLQLSYEDKPRAREGSENTSANAEEAPDAPDTIFSVDFVQEVPGVIGLDGKQGDNQLQKVSIPALALVPMRPLAINEAGEFSYGGHRNSGSSAAAQLRTGHRVETAALVARCPSDQLARARRQRHTRQRAPL